MLRRFLIGSVLAALVATGVVSMPCSSAVAKADTSPGLSLGAPSGPYPVGKVDVELVDGSRSDPWGLPGPRRLMTTIWYPAQSHGKPADYVGSRLAARLDATATPGLGLPRGAVDWAHIGTHASAGVPAAPQTGGRPVLLYSPGGFESRAYNSGTCADLASRGYVVVAVDHTGETDVDFPGGLEPQSVHPGPDGTLDPDLLAKMDQVRVADLRSVLDQLTELRIGVRPNGLPRGLRTALDLSSIAAFGHSGGGDTALQAMSEDPRIHAAANMDGFLGYDWLGEHPMPVVEHGLDRPFLLMGSQSIAAAAPPPGQPTNWEMRTHHSARTWAQLWHRSHAQRFDIGIPRGKHHAFTDHLALLPQLRQAGVSGSTIARLLGTLPDPKRVLRSEHAYLAAFFEQELRHRHQHLLDGPTPANPDFHFTR